MSRKEAVELRGFSILWVGIIRDVFQMDGKKCKDQERLKKKIHVRAIKGALTSVRRRSLGQWQWTRRVLWLPPKFTGGEGRAKRGRRLLRHVTCRSSKW